MTFFYEVTKSSDLRLRSLNFLTNFNSNMAYNMLISAGICRNFTNYLKSDLCQNYIKRKILNN